MQKKASEQKKAEWDASMPVEELMQKMSLEDAKNYLIPIGAYKGKTLGELCVEKPRCQSTGTSSLITEKIMCSAQAQNCCLRQLKNRRRIDA